MKNDSIIYLDTRDLPAPEPLTRVLEILNTSALDVIICMIHRQNPCMLFDILNKRGFTSRVVKGEDQYIIYIWHPSNDHASELITLDKTYVR